MYNSSESWGMPSTEWEQHSILQYTIRATQDQVSPWEGSYTDMLDTPITSPNTDYSESSSKRFSFDENNSTRRNPRFSLPLVKEDYFTPYTNQEPIPNSYSTPESSTSPPARMPEAETKSRPERSRKRKSWQREILPSSDTISPDTPSTATTKSEPSQLAKRNHSCVERAYRDRLNDKIEALAQVLFDSVSAKDSVKPSKCLVISRAKDRLEQLETHNTELQSDVEQLKQQIAVLNHLLSVEKGSA